MNHTITLTECADDWHAYINGDQRRWGCGQSPYEAIGNVVSHHREELGIAVLREIKPKKGNHGN